MAIKAVIFDFDDTLVATNQLFDAVKAAFAKKMAALDLADEQILPILNDFDLANVRQRGGLAKDCFPLALGQTYQHYCHLRAKPCDPALVREFENMGWQVFEEPVTLLPGAKELLTALLPHYRLLLWTQGDPATQEKRFQASGLAPYFSHFETVPAKTAANLSDLIERLKIEKSLSWAIGNSLRCDINPALAIGLKAIHLEISSWEYEHEEAIGFFYRAGCLDECLEIIKNNFQLTIDN
ncbi:MAG: HAD family hydrolase [Clostridiales bacterium]|jgi:putative hydrolase of the HAD superfamily|nr:HAD family hydrolase [Clostridiales bacterium]MDR2711943.1 HAD family hydrolase [Clostridiales bacterium]